MSEWVYWESEPDVQLGELGRIKQWVHPGRLSYGNVSDRIRVNRDV
jgi:hypothetical protein